MLHDESLLLSPSSPLAGQSRLNIGEENRKARTWFFLKTIYAEWTIAVSSFLSTRLKTKYVRTKKLLSPPTKTRQLHAYNQKMSNQQLFPCFVIAQLSVLDGIITLGWPCCPNSQDMNTMGWHRFSPYFTHGSHLDGEAPATLKFPHGEVGSVGHSPPHRRVAVRRHGHTFRILFCSNLDGELFHAIPPPPDERGP